MSTRPTRRTFDLTLDIAAPTEAVWEAISSAEGFKRWFPPQAEMEPGPGGKLSWGWNEYFQWPQVIDVWEPGKRLRTRYDSSVDGEAGKQPLFIEFRLEARGEGQTTLRLVHSGFGPEADFDEEYDGISRGWPIELRSLRLYLENHRGADRRITWSSAPVDLTSKEAWARLAGPDGLGFGSRFDGAREGDPFELAAGDGTTFEGTLLSATPEELTARISSHGNAFLRLSADRCGGTTHVWMWLATYGPVEGLDLERLQSCWDETLTSLFPERADPAAGQPERATAAGER